ncbi:MAG TPA: hypothetical protein DCL61_08945, partial [Cyanobacteria bacterium UBA12227]|nr:hypothetical protein [Cyanobacteria bacterium UBA12227]
MPPKKENNGCGCASIPFSLILVLLGVGYWGFMHLDQLDVSQFFQNNQQNNQQPTIPINQQPSTPNLPPAPTPSLAVANSPVPQVSPTVTPTINPQVSPLPVTPKKSPSPQTPWEKKEIRGIYLSRYQATNNANEQTIRSRVRYYRQQGINTIIQGVWGNGCTMYNSEVMQQTFGYKSCPNQFQEQW